MLVELKHFDVRGLKVVGAGEEGLCLVGAARVQLEVVAMAQIRVAAAVGVRVVGYFDVVSAAKGRSVARAAVDAVGAGGLDRNEQRHVARIDEAEDERLGVDLVAVGAVPGHLRIAAEHEAQSGLGDDERARPIVALGVEVGGSEAVACRSIDELELASVELAERDELLLRLRRGENARLDHARRVHVLQVAAQLLDSTACTRSGCCFRLVRHELDELIVDELLLELDVELTHLLAQRVALDLNLLPLLLVAVERLQVEVEVLLLQSDLVLEDDLVDGVDVGAERLVRAHVVDALLLAGVELVDELGVVLVDARDVGLALLVYVVLDLLEVLDQVLFVVESRQLVEQSRQVGELLLGHLVLAAVAQAEQVRHVRVARKRAAIRLGQRVHVLAEVALDATGVGGRVVADQHGVDVLAARAMAARQDAHVLVDLVAAVVFAHD